MELNRDEIDLAIHMIEEVWDNMTHFPNDWTDKESLAASTLYEKVQLAEKQLRAKRK